MDDLIIVIAKLVVFLVVVFVFSQTKFFKEIKKRLFNNEKNK
jgi:LytS/YehU family sensor histidine kinase